MVLYLHGVVPSSVFWWRREDGGAEGVTGQLPSRVG